MAKDRVKKYPFFSDKLVSQETKSDSKPKKDIVVDEVNLNEISNNTITSLTNNESVLELFPDINLAMDIVVSSIISPKDLMTTNLNYRLTDSELSINTSQLLLTEIEEHINKNYGLESKLETIVKEALFTKGAYIEALIPNNALTEIIKRSTEEKNKVGVEEFVDTYVEKNFMLPRHSDIKTEENSRFKTEAGLLEEKIEVNELIEFTDRLEVLAVPTAMRKINEKSIHKKMSIGLEAYDDNVDMNIELAFRKLKETKGTPILGVTTAEETNLRADEIPLVMKLPVESVIPVHAIGDPSEHLGYFVLIDASGSPIVAGDNWFSGSDNDLIDVYKASLIDKANNELNKRVNRATILKNLDVMYDNIIDKRLRDVLRKSDELKDIADVTMVRHVYRTMLSRVLKHEKTRMLFLPREIVQFYAFDYRNNGTGASLLEKVSILSSIRAILMFGNIMSTIKNSIPTTKLTVELDEKDPDPARTKERIIAETLKNRQLEMPIGILNVHDLTQWVHKLGYMYEFNHPNLPNIKIDLEDVSRSITQPEESLEEDMRNRILMTLGVTPELVDSGKDVEFAATIITNNALLARRIQKRQMTLQTHLTNHVRMIIKNDGMLFRNIESIVKNDLDKIRKRLEDANPDYTFTDESIVYYIINDIVKHIEIALPGIETNTDEGLAQAFENYRDNLETAIESVLGEDAITPELASDLGDRIDEYRKVVYHTLLRKWMRDNGYMTELNTMIMNSSEDESKYEFVVLDEYIDYLDKLAKGLKPALRKDKKIKKVLTKVFTKFDEDGGDDEDEGGYNDNQQTEETPQTDEGDTGDETKTDDNENDEETGGNVDDW